MATPVTTATTGRQHRELVHTRTVAAPADDLYQLVARVDDWPALLEPCVHTRYLRRSPGEERFQLWAVVNGEVVDWTSRRELDRPGLRIAFAQERSFPPVTAMDGDWTFRPLADGRTEIVLRHRFAVDGDRRALERVAAGVDHNSEKELAALERVAAQGHPVDDVVLTFADTVPLPQGTASAYRFVAESDRWPTRLPHVRRVTLRRPGPGVQDMEMETVTQDGGVHTTRSLRLCFPEENRIVYTQLRPPSVLLGHSGSWVFTGGPVPQAVATHTVVIDAKRVPQLLGPDATLADARAHLRTVLGANSRATLGAASAGTEAGP